MTRAHYLLAELANRGVSIAVEGNQLRLRPRSAMTEGLIARVLASKRELIVLLRSASPRAQVQVSPLAPLQWWVLWVLAQTPNLSRGALHSCVPAPREAVDGALGALLERGEVRATCKGGIELNAC
jgi:TubC N-terminal docking domain